MKGQNWGKSMKEVNVAAISGNKENIVTLEFYVNKKNLLLHHFLNSKIFQIYCDLFTVKIIIQK